MRVSGFMVPADKVVTVCPEDTVHTVTGIMLTKKVGAVVVTELREKDAETAGDGEEKPEEGEEAQTKKAKATMLPMPAGIITKSDVLRAYHDRVDIDDPCRAIMCNRDLVTCTPNDDRDRVARILEKNHNHHIIVVDEQHAHFVGLISSWDIAAECARDDRAWPYIRSEDGKVKYSPKIETEPLPDSYNPEKPTTIVNHPHSDKTTYMDDCDLEAFQ